MREILNGSSSDVIDITKISKAKKILDKRKVKDALTFITFMVPAAFHVGKIDVELIKVPIFKLLWLSDAT